MRSFSGIKEIVKVIIAKPDDQQQRQFFQEAHVISIATQIFGIFCWLMSLSLMESRDSLNPWACIVSLAGMVGGAALTYFGKNLRVILFSGAVCTLFIGLGYRVLIANVTDPSFWVLPTGLLITMTIAPIFNSIVYYLVLFVSVWSILGVDHFPIHRGRDDEYWGPLTIGASLAIGMSLNISFLLLRIKNYQAQKDLKAMAYTDGLTGLNNRRRFTDCAQELLRLPFEGPHYFLMIDIDDFKKINDSKGHDVGDEVLRDTAGAIAVCALEHLSGRLGGEEFGILFAGDDVAACIFANTLLQAVSGAKRRVANVSVSIGMADVRFGDELATCYKRADEALYAAKLNGKNQFCCAPPRPTPGLAA